MNCTQLTCWDRFESCLCSRTILSRHVSRMGRHGDTVCKIPVLARLHHPPQLCQLCSMLPSRQAGSDKQEQAIYYKCRNILSICPLPPPPPPPHTHTHTHSVTTSLPVHILSGKRLLRELAYTILRIQGSSKKSKSSVTFPPAYVVT